MKILHVITSAKAEGTPNLVLSWLSNKNLEQKVLVLNPQGELLHHFQQNGHIINTDFVPSVKQPWKIVRLVRSVCKEIEPDAVISWPTGHSQWVHLGAQLAGVKNKLTHIGNAPGEKFFGRYLATALTFWTSLFTGAKFVACSQYVVQEYKKLAIVPQKIHVVYNSFDFQKFCSTSASKPRKDVAMVGYMEEVRDHKTLLLAWESIQDKIDGQLNLIGEGSLLPSLKAMVKDRDIKRVNFLGRVTNVNEILASTKVYVLSTRSEGFGITLLEAMASGCEVVASDVPAVREVLSDGEFGELFPVGDKDALAQYILQCYQNDGLASEKYAKKMKYLKSFSPEEMINAYVQLMV